MDRIVNAVSPHKTISEKLQLAEELLTFFKNNIEVILVLAQEYADDEEDIEFYNQFRENSKVYFDTYGE